MAAPSDPSGSSATTASAAAVETRALLARGLQLALTDLSQGRAELRQALLQFAARGDAAGQLVAAAALVQFIGIADDDYSGFEAAVAQTLAAAGALSAIVEPEHRMLARTGLLVAGWFEALDDPALAEAADALAADTLDEACPAPVRCCAGMAVLAYYQTRLNAEGVLWIELAMRPLLAEPSLSPRLRDEWHHMLVQALYLCGRPDQALQVRQAHRDGGVPPLPVVALKHHLLDAQTAIGDGRADTGRAALDAAEPLLDPRAPRLASWWHLLRSRQLLTEGRHRDALTHARLALRLATATQYPSRWMGVTIMQEGQVLVADGSYAEAVPFFERAARVAIGSQADFCWCQRHLAQALALSVADSAAPEALRQALAEGFALARRRDWPMFFRPSARSAAMVCALALEQRVETAFVRRVVAQRALEAVRPDLVDWPWPIRIVTLGRFRIDIEGEPLRFSGKVAKKPLQLLQFIIASGGHDVSMASAMFALWPELEGDKAKSACNVALHRLRKLLRYDEAVHIEQGQLALDTRLVWVDCLAFEQLADRLGGAAGRIDADAEGLARRALALYAGPYLHDTGDEAWQLVHRTRLASKFKRLSALLARAAIARADARAARAVLEQALEHEPQAEDLARELMQLLHQGGEQAAALAVFERCRRAIEHGLGARPSPSTLVLLQRIRAGR